MILDFIEKCDGLRTLRLLKDRIIPVIEAKLDKEIAPGEIDIPLGSYIYEFRDEAPNLYIRTVDGTEYNAPLIDFTRQALSTISSFASIIDNFNVAKPSLRFQYSVGFATIEEAQSAIKELSDYFLIWKAIEKNTPTPFYIIYRAFKFAELKNTPVEYFDDVRIRLGAAVMTTHEWNQLEPERTLVKNLEGCAKPLYYYLVSPENSNTYRPVVIYDPAGN